MDFFGQHNDMPVRAVYKCKGWLQRRVKITDGEWDKCKYCCVRYSYPEWRFNQRTFNITYKWFYKARTEKLQNIRLIQASMHLTTITQWWLASITKMACIFKPLLSATYWNLKKLSYCFHFGFQIQWQKYPWTTAISKQWHS